MHQNLEWIKEVGLVISQELLNKTYKNDLVKEKLNNYEHLLFESKTQEGMEYIKQYNINSYPTQVIINEGNTIVLNGYLNSEKEIYFLTNNDFIIKNSKLTQFKTEQDDVSFTKIELLKICYKISSAKASGENPYDAFLNTLKTILKQKNFTDFQNIEEFASDNFEKLKCKNRNSIRMREVSSIFKYAIDSRNYELVKNAIFIKVDGKNVCNPNIDFNKSEIVNGKEETLLDFIDLLLNKSGMEDFYGFDNIKNIKMRIKGCLNKTE